MEEINNDRMHNTEEFWQGTALTANVLAHLNERQLERGNTSSIWASSNSIRASGNVIRANVARSDQAPA